jgi:hypothetical protein
MNVAIFLGTCLQQQQAAIVVGINLSKKKSGAPHTVVTAPGMSQSAQ